MPDRDARRTSRWIPGLDGLRAVAVIAVVLFHLDPDYLPGGFLGVDIFFVISGYLITRLLLTELQTTGRIRLGRFYLRRARRLLPAVLLLLAVVVLASVAIWRDQLASLAGIALSSLAYVTNWHLIADQQSYFASMGRPPMLQHLWSLAIEEQYYLIWAPLVIVLAGAWLARRRARPTTAAWTVAGVAALLAVASTVAMTVIAIRTGVPYHADSSRVYFGTDTHAMGLLLGSCAGALAACVASASGLPVPQWLKRTPAWRIAARLRPARAVAAVGGGNGGDGATAGTTNGGDGARPDCGAASTGRFAPWMTDVAAVLGLAVLIWWMSATDEFSPALYRGGFLAFSALALLVVCAAARPAGRVGRWLDMGPLRWVGRRSYAIYLWHWPVVVVTRPLIDVAGPAWLIQIARAGLALALAAASYRYLEDPVRRGRFRIPNGLRVAIFPRTATPDAPAAGPMRSHRTPRPLLLPVVAAGCVAVLLMGGWAMRQQQPLSAPSASEQGAGTVAVIPSVDPGQPPTLGGDPESGTTGSADPGTTPGRGGSAPWAAPSGQSPDGAWRSGATATAAASAAASAADPASSPAPSPAPIPASSVTAATPPTAQPAPASIGTGSPPPSTTPTAGSTSPATPPANRARSASVSAFGDSVLLGASPALARVVGKLSVDAVVGRQAYATLGAVAADQKARSLAPIVLIHTGNNGVISPSQLAGTLTLLADRKQVILINDHVDRPWQGPNNRVFASVAGKYRNVTVIDWNSAATEHPGWLGPDGIHLNGTGAAAYAKLVTAAIG